MLGAITPLLLVSPEVHLDSTADHEDNTHEGAGGLEAIEKEEGKMKGELGEQDKKEDIQY